MCVQGSVVERRQGFSCKSALTVCSWPLHDVIDNVLEFSRIHLLVIINLGTTVYFDVWSVLNLPKEHSGYNQVHTATGTDVIPPSLDKCSISHCLCILGIAYL